jgi:hypothetical protein
MSLVLQEIEEEDAQWEESRKKKAKKEEPSSAQATVTPDKTEEPHSKPTKSNAPAGFY